ncbi:MAG: VapC toxin protein, partial [uncultured Thermomicrobiales bacterium]
DRKRCPRRGRDADRAIRRAHRRPGPLPRGGARHREHRGVRPGAGFADRGLGGRRL